MFIMLWIAALIIFAIAEAATPGLVSIWFAFGSLGALIVAIAGGSVGLQLIVFFLVTAVALVVTRPLAKKFMINNTTHTNADRVLGKIGIVIEAIDNVADTGRVSMEGSSWKARSETGEVIPKDSRVKGIRIEGVTLFVAEEATVAQSTK